MGDGTESNVLEEFGVTSEQDYQERIRQLTEQVRNNDNIHNELRAEIAHAEARLAEALRGNEAMIQILESLESLSERQLIELYQILKARVEWIMPPCDEPGALVDDII